jgi:hypothetical protein
VDELPRRIKEELDRRDDTLLALELLVVDQASRLLALESLVLKALAREEIDLAAVALRVREAAERFRSSFERIEGFAERAQRIAGELIEEASAAHAEAATKPARKPRRAGPGATRSNSNSKAGARAKTKARRRPG